MPSYLEVYTSGVHKSADNREYKFIRAVDSFLRQSYNDSELIIVADGCSKTSKIYNDLYINEEQIKLVQIKKQPPFSGYVRQCGIKQSSGDIICYLDSDDIIGENHLDIISNGIDNENDWFYYDDYLFDGFERNLRSVKVEHCYIGTSSFCHKKDINLKWLDGYGHDWLTISTILNKKNKKIKTPEYYVCHVSGLGINY
jgi:glycosyltransferase involved in cell wall biosynthesis